jgi:hypothetical protein
MFAGPNGSGKSTLKSYLPTELLGVYLNPDEIEQDVRRQGFLDFAAYGVATTSDEVLSFFRQSPRLITAGFGDTTEQLGFAYGRLDFGKVAVNSHFAAAAEDFLTELSRSQNIHNRLWPAVKTHPFGGGGVWSAARSATSGVSG